MKFRLMMKVLALASLLIIATSREGNGVSSKSARETTNVPSKPYASIRKKSVKNVTKGTIEWYIIIFILIAVLVVSTYSQSQTLPRVLLLLHILSALAAPNEMPKTKSLKRGTSVNYCH